MKERTKPPVRRVYADDLAVELDGQVVYPHAGEWVEFRGRPTVGQWMSDIEGLTFKADLESETGQEALLARYRGIIATVAKSIVAWNWTNDAGEPMAPPTAETLRECLFEELTWLQRAMGGRAGETLPLTDGSPSTAPSTDAEEDGPPASG